MCKKHLFTALLLLSAFVSFGQYTPGSHVVVNDAVAPAQPTPLDARSMFYDGTNFLYRAYNGTAEVLTYLNTTAYRSGHFIIVVDSGGSLQSNGTYIGGYNTFYMFKDSTTAGGLVKMNLFGTGAGTCSTCLLAANNLSDLASLSTALVNLGLNNVNNTSDATKNAATVTLTNHTISGTANTLTNIPNSALTNNSIGLTVTSTSASDIVVTTTPAALGTSLVINIPTGGTASRGAISSSDWNFFDGKLDSVRISNDSVYNCVNGTCTLQSVISGTGGVNSVNGTNTSLLFSPYTGNVLGQVNPAYSFTWTAQHTFTSFAPIFSTLTTPGGIFYGSNSSGQLSQSGAGTTGQILESPGDGTAPIFFTPGPMTVEGWLGFTPLSASLGSTQIYVGNAMNTAQAVNLSGAASLSNTGALTLIPTITAGSCTNCTATYNAAGQLTSASSGGAGFSLTTNATGNAAGAPTLASTVLNIDTLAYGKIFNIKDFGAKADGRQSFNFVTTGSSDTATCSDCNFVSGRDNGKSIRIDGAGAAGAALVTTFTVVNGTTITLGSTAGTSASTLKGVYGTDNTPSIQAAINAAGANRGGTVFGPAGWYIIAGALQTSVSGANPNSQLYMPLVEESAGRNVIGGQWIGITIKGESSPQQSQQPIGDTTFKMSGTIFYSIIDGTATGSVEPAVFGSRSADSYNNGENGVDWSFEDLVVMTPASTSIGGINGFWASTTKIKNIDVLCDWTGVFFSMPEPTADIAAVITNQRNTEVLNSVDNIWIVGYKYGLITSDYAQVKRATIFLCPFARIFSASEESQHDDMDDIQWCPVPVYLPVSAIVSGMIPAISGYTYFNIDLLGMELFYQSGNWYDVQTVVSDSNNYGRGNINYSLSQAGYGTTPATQNIFSKYNADSIQCYNIGKPVGGGGGSQSLDATLAIGNSSARQLLITGSNTTAPNVTAGDGISLQSISFDNNILGFNAYYNSGLGGFTTSTTGYGFLLNADQNGIFYKAIGNTTAGSLATSTGPFGIGLDGNVYLGGSTSATTAPYTGSTMTVNGSDVLINTTTDQASSILTMGGTSRGFLPPVMTTTQFKAISSPASGLHAILSDSSYRLGLWNGAKYVTYATTDMLGAASGVTTVGTFSGSSITNGASISTNTITFGPADGTNPGMVTTGTQTLAGNKLFPASIDIGGTAGPGAAFTIDGNVSASSGPSQRGFWFNMKAGNTFTEGSSGAIGSGASAYFGGNTFTAGSATTYTNAATLQINGAPTAGTNVTFSNVWALYVAAGNGFFGGNISSTIGNAATFTHFLGNNQSTNAPTIAAGAGAGTSPSVSISGGDQDGLITVTTGTLPTGSATVATITYGYAFPNNSYVVLYPANTVTAALGTLMVYTTGSASNFTLTSPVAGLGASATYKWNYHAGGN